MKKIISSVILLLLASLACSLTTGAPGASLADTSAGEAVNNTPADVPPIVRPATALPALQAVCAVSTGLANGDVNLRACAGAHCPVLQIVTERQELTIITAGEWNQVQTAEGLTGFIHSKYCPVISPTREETKP